MDKSNTICFQTIPKISNALEKIAMEKKLSVSELINIIINRHINGILEFQGINPNSRRFERKKVHLPAYIGNPSWQRYNFKPITIMDISMGGIRFSVPKGSRLEIHKKRNTHNEKFIIIFRLPNYHWPVKVRIDPHEIYKSTEDIQVRASFVDPDFHAYSALQKYIN